MRGILGTVFVLMAFGFGTARVQSIPKEELKVFVSVLMTAAVFSSSQNSEANACPSEDARGG